MSRSAWCLLATGFVFGCGDADLAEKDKKKPASAAAAAEKVPFKALDEKNVKTTKSGLKIEDVKVGEGEEAKRGNVVMVHYTGWLTDGKQFDSSVGQDPFTLVLGASEVIAGWDEGVMGMKEGGKRKLQIPPELGYGKRGAGDDIPPDSTLVFDIELLKVKPGVKIEEVKEGDGKAAKPGDVIEVHYTGKLESGKVFDSSAGKAPITFQLGARRVIKGWDAGLVGLKVGGKRKLTIAPELAYGKAGSRDVIPPNATLIFDVELVKIR